MGKRKIDTKFEELCHKYDENRQKIKPVFDFMQDNQQLVEDFHKKIMFDFSNPKRTGRDKLYRLFVDSINAAGGNNLTTTGISCKKFYEVLERVPDSDLLDFKSFMKEFSDKEGKIANIFETLRSNDYPNFGAKKAALFIRSLYILQLNKQTKIFHNLKIEKKDLYIPVDVVICEMLNQLLGIGNDKKLKLKAASDFQRVNDFAKRYFEDFMLIEDFWYWGYFNTKIIDKNGYRQLGFNEDKFYASPWGFPNKSVEAFHLEFVDIFKRNSLFS